MSDQQPDPRLGPLRVRPSGLVAAGALLVSLFLGPMSASAQASDSPTARLGARSAQTRDSDVELTVEAGLAGVISAGVPLPVRLTVTSKRARVVTVNVSTQQTEESQTVELGADAPTVVDVALKAAAWIDISVRDSRGANLANRSTALTPDPSRTVVAVGPSLFAKGVPAKSPTIGGIQQASLLALTDELLARPGALRSISGVVLDAADLDRLTGATRDALREWVWEGGDLVLDIEPRAELPVVDQPSTGRATPVGSGWVRFSSGAAELGAWSTVLEPAPVRSNFNGGMDPGSIQSMLMNSGGLVSVGFIPTWVVALAVFGSALVAGPIAWFVLRTRRRRQLIWGIAPGLSLVVAAALLISGQGVFTGATTRTVADIDSSTWSSTGSLFSGIKESKTLEIGGGGQLIAAVPDPSVTSSGSTQTVRVDLPRNSFGTVAIGGVTFEKAPRLEVTAVALDDGTAKVTVTNKSNALLQNVSITGNGRIRLFKSVGPGKSETLPFQMSSDINVANQVFADPAGMGIGSALGLNNPIPGLDPTQSRGLILVSGVIETSMKAAGLAGDGPVSVRAIVPVQPAKDQDGTAALRIDEVGGLSAWQRQTLLDQGMDAQGLGDGNVPTTVVTVERGDGDGPVVQPPDYVRLSSQRGREAQACGVSTIAPKLEVWNGTGWVPLEKVDEPYMDPRVMGIQDGGHQMQDWMIPAVEAGGRIHLRVSGRMMATPASMLFLCGGRP